MIMLSRIPRYKIKSEHQAVVPWEFGEGQIEVEFRVTFEIDESDDFAIIPRKTVGIDSVTEYFVEEYRHGLFTRWIERRGLVIPPVERHQWAIQFWALYNSEDRPDFEEHFNDCCYEEVLNG